MLQCRTQVKCQQLKMEIVSLQNIDIVVLHDEIEKICKRKNCYEL